MPRHKREIRETWLLIFTGADYHLCAQIKATREQIICNDPQGEPLCWQVFSFWLVSLRADSAQSRAAGPDAGEEAAVKRIVDGIMQPYIAQNNVRGAIVGVSLHGHRYYFPYGQATDSGAPFTPDTLVEIGSCTKVYTTTLFALAINRNQIDPNASAQKYMPSGYTAAAGGGGDDSARTGGLHFRIARRSHQPAARAGAAQHRALHHEGLPDLGFTLDAPLPHCLRRTCTRTPASAC